MSQDDRNIFVKDDDIDEYLFIAKVEKVIWYTSFLMSLFVISFLLYLCPLDWTEKLIKFKDGKYSEVEMLVILSLVFGISAFAANKISDFIWKIF